MLEVSRDRLSAHYDVAMLDLDGVVYRGSVAIPGVPEAVAAARRAGQRIAFVTNNASRSAAAVADKLTAMDVPAEADDVVTSAQAAAELLALRHPAGARILVLGSEGLIEAVRARGLVPVAAPTDAGPELDASAVVTGFGPEVRWAQIIRVACLIRDGLDWVAANADLTFPTDYGIAPGHGVLVQLLSDFSGVLPAVAGKPEPPLLLATMQRTGARRALMVGDRLDTDIEGAHRAGVDSLLVMTGVSGLQELVEARPDQRPTWISAGLEGLTEVMEVPEVDDAGASLRGQRARVVAGRLEAVPAAPSAVDAGAASAWWRVVAAVAWRHLDETGTSVNVAATRQPA